MSAAADIDRTLAELRDGADRLGEQLLALELDGDRKLLDDVALEGETAARWSAVAGDLLLAWDEHAQLTAARSGCARRCGPRRRPARSRPPPARRGRR